MKIEIIEQPNKMVIFWISKAESANTELHQSLALVFEEWRKNNYMPFIIESGSGNIEDNMYSLMKRNHGSTASNNFSQPSVSRNMNM